MSDIAGSKPVDILRQVIIQMVFVVNFVRVTEAQVHVPLFKSVEMQATIAPLGQMVTGNFSGRNDVAAICKVEKAVYFFEPDSMENLILTNVVSLPDTPIAISKGQEVVLDSTDHERHLDKLAVLTCRHSVLLISFGKDGRPIISQQATVDAYTTDVRTADLETSGKLDIITFGKFCLGVSVAKNIGGGRLQEAHLVQGPLGSIPFSSIAFTDFNGDLVPDMAALDWVNHRLLIFYGRGDGTFAQPVSFQLKAEPSTLSVADLNGNGYPDILIGYSRLDQIDLYAGDGFGRFFLRQTMKTTGPVSKFAVADFTGNGAMDIAALSSKEKQITFFSYDPVSRIFSYAGTIGTGENYDDIVPFDFPNRLRADLVASSLSEKYIKVFKTSVLFNKSPDIFLPVSEDAEYLSVFGDDTLNYVMVADSSGEIRTTRYNGTTPMDAGTTDEFQTEGLPASVKLITPERLHLLLSYKNADMVTVYDILSKDKESRNVMTAYLPFVVNGATRGDSTIIAAAYPIEADSEIGVSYFTSFTKGNSDFIEKDYVINGMKDYLSTAITIEDPSFYGIWKSGTDTLTFTCTNLKDDRAVAASIQGSDAKLRNLDGQLYLFVEDSDTLSMFGVMMEKPMLLSLHRICVIPFDSSDLRSIHVSVMGSVFYLAFFDSTQNAVSLYSATESRSKFIRSWRVNSEPEDVDILPSMRRIYFLNRTEAYVSIHNF
jgi:hypothetical protein